MRAGKPSLPRLSYDKTRLRVEPEEKVLPLRLASHGEENPENCGRGHGCQHRPGASCASVTRRTILGAKTRFQLRPDRLEGGSIALESGKCRGLEHMNGLDRFLQSRTQFARRSSADYRRKIGVAPKRYPDLQLADSKLYQR